MKSKHVHEKEQVFDASEFRNFVLTWKTAKMKETLGYKSPPGFLKLKEQLDDEVLEIVEIKEGISLNLCLCGKIPHDACCLTWPHLTLSVLNSEGQLFAIHSLWLEPVEFLPTVEKVVHEFEVKGEVLENKIRDAIVEPFQKTIESEQEIVVEKFLKNFSVEDRNDLIVVHFDAKGELTICQLDKFEKDDFIFDYASGSWIFGDTDGTIGKASFLGNNQQCGFMLILEGKVEQVRELSQVLTTSLKAIFNKEINQINQTKAMVTQLFEFVIGKN